METGILLKGIGGFYYVQVGDTIYECKARGLFRKQGRKPVAGDQVNISVTGEETASLDEILPRKNVLTRPPVANLDQLFLVTSVCDPVPNVLVLDKMIAVAEDHGIDPVVVMTKADLGDITPWRQVYGKTGLTFVEVSSITGQGILEMKSLLKGKISAFSGNSGVGKSTLLNAIGEGYDLPTGEISQKLGRGRHTTRQVELFPLSGGGYVADTPGFSTVDMERYDMVKKDQLQYAFREFAPYLGQCKFPSCSHIREKGCAVLAAVQQGEIAPSRHQSYAAMYEEVKEVKEWQKRV